VNRVVSRMRIARARPEGTSPTTTFAPIVHTTAECMGTEAPGGLLSDLAPTHTVPVAAAGRAVAGLAIITALEHHDLMHALSQTLSLLTEWGAAIEGAAWSEQFSVSLHEAVIPRTVRELERGKTHLASGTAPLDGGDPDGPRASLHQQHHRTLRRTLTGGLHLADSVLLGARATTIPDRRSA
jgi:hypothetical protein